MQKILFYSIILFIFSNCQQLTFRKIVKNSSCTSTVSAAQIEKDIIFLENYIQKKPKKELAYYILAMRYYRQQNLEQSIQVWDKLIKINPSHAQALANRGVCYLSLKNKDAAQADFQQAIKLGFDEQMLDGQTLSEYLQAQ